MKSAIGLPVLLAALFVADGAHAQNGPAFSSCAPIPAGDLVIVGPAPNPSNCLADGGSTTPSSIVQEVKIAGVSANTALSPALPNNCTLFLITAQETSGNAVTGGLIFGTSTGGSQILATGGTLGASGFLTVNPGGFLEQQIGGQTVWVSSSNWGSGVVSVQAYCLEQ